MWILLSPVSYCSVMAHTRIDTTINRGSIELGPSELLKHNDTQEPLLAKVSTLSLPALLPASKETCA